VGFFGRGKNTIQNPFTFKEMYCDYIKDKEKNSPYYISYKTYVKICSKYFKKIMEHVILKGDEFKMPFKLGKIAVKKKKMDLSKESTVLPIDWKNTLKYGKIINHLNEHSSGYKYRFHWNKQKAIFINKTFYRFVPTRSNKRFLTEVIFNPEINVDYYES